MRKYLGSTKTELSVKGNSIVKEEAFDTSHVNDEEAMYMYSGSPRGRGRGGGRGRSYARGRGNHQRGGNSNFPPRQRSNAQQRARFNSNARPRGGARRRETNPLDDDGYPMTCNICGSIFHFSGRNGAGCPESYENQQQVNVAGNVNPEAEEANICGDILIKYEEVFQMRSSEEALQDSCCSANVMGDNGKTFSLMLCLMRTKVK